MTTRGGDLQALLDRAVRAGCTTWRTGSGHWMVRCPNGASVLCASTPRHPKWDLRRTISRLRREGVQL